MDKLITHALTLTLGFALGGLVTNLTAPPFATVQQAILNDHHARMQLKSCKETLHDTTSIHRQN